jgi:hypothetical protein
MHGDMGAIDLKKPLAELQILVRDKFRPAANLNIFLFEFEHNWCIYALVLRNLLQNCLISVLKIGEKIYAKWLLYPNKNYSYSSCNPFIDKAPYWRE